MKEVLRVPCEEGNPRRKQGEVASTFRKFEPLFNATLSPLLSQYLPATNDVRSMKGESRICGITIT